MAEQLPTTITMLTERIRHITQDVITLHSQARDFIDSIQGPEPTPPAPDTRSGLSTGIKTPASTLSEVIEELSNELHRLHYQFRRVNVGGEGEQSVKQAGVLR